MMAAVMVNPVATSATARMLDRADLGSIATKAAPIIGKRRMSVRIDMIRLQDSTHDEKHHQGHSQYEKKGVGVDVAGLEQAHASS